MKNVVLPSALALIVATSAQSPAPKQVTPSSAASSPAEYCPVTVSRVESLDDGHTISFALRSLLGSGRASGTITAYVGDDRYTISFREKYAVGILNDGVPNPIVVRFPQPVRIAGASVTALDDPSPGPCRPLQPFVDEAAIAAISPAPRTYNAARPADAFVNASLLADPVDAPAPIRELAPDCDEPYRRAGVAQLARLDFPDAAHRMHLAGDVRVLVTLGSDGVPMGTKIISSPNPIFNTAAVTAAIHSTYRPQRFRCDAVGGQLPFTARFVIR